MHDRVPDHPLDVVRIGPRPTGLCLMKVCWTSWPARIPSSGSSCRTCSAATTSKPRLILVRPITELRHGRWLAAPPARGWGAQADPAAAPRRRSEHVTTYKSCAPQRTSQSATTQQTRPCQPTPFGNEITLGTKHCSISWPARMSSSGSSCSSCSAATTSRVRIQHRPSFRVRPSTEASYPSSDRLVRSLRGLLIGAWPTSMPTSSPPSCASSVRTWSCAQPSPPITLEGRCDCACTAGPFAVVTLG
jgi:hypothetical protein